LCLSADSGGRLGIGVVLVEGALVRVVTDV
jgi:hypothetical protein